MKLKWAKWEYYRKGVTVIIGDFWRWDWCGWFQSDCIMAAYGEVATVQYGSDGGNGGTIWWWWWYNGGTMVVQYGDNGMMAAFGDVPLVQYGGDGSW